MHTESAKARIRFAVVLLANHVLDEGARLEDVFRVECTHADGRLVWRAETVRDLVESAESAE